MNAVDTIETLLKLGITVKDQASGSTVNITKILANQDVQKGISDLLGTLSEGDLEATIQALQQKETALLNGQTIADLSGDKLRQYSDLLDAENVLVGKEAALGASQEFLSWLVDDALPILVRVAPVVIPLLV
jgi:hypothetical protein